MELRTVQLSELKPAAYNPRVPLKPGDPEYEALALSIERNGYIEPIVVNSDLTIISGHQRRTVMMDLGRTEAEVIIVDIQDPEREKAANIALNKITGRWDEKALYDLLIDLEQAGADLAETGFSTDDLSELFTNIDISTEANDDGYDAGRALQEKEAAGPPRTKYGDIWELGEHRLMCGDAADFNDVGLLMAGAEADLIITDPPYNVDYEAKDKSLESAYKRNTTRKVNEIIGDRMDDDEFYNFLFRVFSNFCDIAKPGAAVYVFHADIEGLTFRQAFDASGFALKQVLIWEKNQFVIGRQDYHWRHEPILYGWKEGAAHYFIDDRHQDTVIIEDDIDFSAMKKPELVAYIEKIRSDLAARTSVQYEKKPAKSDMHPTMKPVALVGRFIQNSSRHRENVVDLFAGSGTTLIAAEQLHRVAYLMELNPIYCDVIIDRWEAFTGRRARRVRGGGD